MAPSGDGLPPSREHSRFHLTITVKPPAAPFPAPARSSSDRSAPRSRPPRRTGRRRGCPPTSALRHRPTGRRRNRASAAFPPAHSTAPRSAPRAATCCERSLHRSEEHTSELQSLMRISYAVLCLKKKKPQTYVREYTI